MANTYEKLRDLLEGEIDEITKGGSLDKEKLHCIYEMIDIIKDMGEIDDHDSGYSTGRVYYDPMMHGYSGMNRNNGRYSRTGYSRGGSYNSGMSYRGGGYSRGGDVMSNLQSMMQDAQTEQERDAIRRVMDMM